MLIPAMVKRRRWHGVDGGYEYQDRNKDGTDRSLLGAWTMHGAGKNDNNHDALGDDSKWNPDRCEDGEMVV